MGCSQWDDLHDQRQVLILGFFNAAVHIFFFYCTESLCVVLLSCTHISYTDSQSVIFCTGQQHESEQVDFIL